MIYSYFLLTFTCIQTYFYIIFLSNSINYIMNDFDLSLKVFVVT